MQNQAVRPAGEQGNRRALSTHLLLLGQLLSIAHEAAGVDQQEVAVAPEAARVQPAVVGPTRGLEPGKEMERSSKQGPALPCRDGTEACEGDLRRGGGAL